MWESLITLPALAGLTIVLGIDNVLAIAVIARGVEPSRQGLARKTGILVAFSARLILLVLLAWVLKAANMHLGLGDLTVRDGLLVLGGGFLIIKSVYELRERTRLPEPYGHQSARRLSFRRAVLQIVVIDIALSLDSVITVVGMAPTLALMMAAITVEVAVILFFSGAICRLLERYPSIETLAICALLVVGVVLISDGINMPLNKNTVYAMMAFALFVELINLRIEYVAARKTSSHQYSRLEQKTNTLIR